MFRQAKRRTAGRRNFDTKNVIYQSSKLAALYTSRLSFYDIPPLEEITLEEFESWAIDRLKVLIEIESCTARSKSFKEIEQIIKPVVNKYLPLSPLIEGKNDAQVLQERKKDHYSHYILRLVFCRTDELRKKFVKNEMLLFKIRYGNMQLSEKSQFIELHNDTLDWNYIGAEEKTELFEDLFNATSASIRTQMMLDNEKSTITGEQLRQHILRNESFIKLPFEKIPNLVGSRSILVRQGYGYIPTSFQLNLLVIEVQENLSKNLVKTFQAIPRLDEDDRLVPLLQALSKNFSSVQYDSNFGDESASDINATSITSNKIMSHYPLCAKVLQKSLVANHHLRFQGRQQLSLFLKGIGLNVDEALRFWSTQFTSGNTGISLEKFNKEYKYNIRHSYGLEGARINYKPWDCATILSKPKPNKSESHGCPYRDLKLEVLVDNLKDMGITEQSDLNVIIDDVNKNSYTVACTRVFELTHKKQLKPNENLHINHPNLYFDRSRQLEKAQS
ncbi:DNA primase subunit pri2 [Yamadazyma tenuis]|uniref:DNA primase large subunit n=1 Tax=Candida tenuis (strain ATCC 10573 / BCRC 21748 / CBS 615 / JCM 9827 / NBRC 10315 / NRRL Y-1498 / VKM Y-70) TaxID=590646 RepID=G3B0F3_CANTC|nr:uncharacterized protein CANTEDRAFT_119727 [Yamadazyma tenuis ATCC 10573]XP_006685073.1 DNA primase, large subunit [Yamadazyma tenuis ATCC 10573]EGV65386.1 hypothetical protein CANTEDRAFT_119727 [Yamadazyma tenuis ATCC 10573]EGV65387.1 DNA primase, large subunit [Yamadazyma tenuis ATCC 10573]WEJ94944.1 DNA primase subunit pri2 [Yamadazyma tenuis]